MELRKGRILILDKVYEEKVYAGILGKIIGVYLGRPFEGWTYERIMEELGPINYYVNDKLKQPICVTDDDITGTFTFLRALKDFNYDKNITAKQIGLTWLNNLNEDTIKQEMLLTILSVASENLENNLFGNRTLIDQRSMPSMYLLNKIKNSSENNNFSELALSVNITMIDKTWIEIHPEHLRILLYALKKNYTQKIFNKIVLEILEENKII